jgi:hypothetical protein
MTADVVADFGKFMAAAIRRQAEERGFDVERHLAGAAARLVELQPLHEPYNWEATTVQSICEFGLQAKFKNWARRNGYNVPFLQAGDDTVN